jgi:hypothetical protein
LRRQLKVSNRQYAGRWIEHLVEPQEVDGNGRIVFGNLGLLWDLAHLLAQINPDGAVDNGDEQNNPRALFTNAASQAEDDQALVFGNDADGICQNHQRDQNECANCAQK